MTDTGKYCCFNCPKGGHEEKRLQDKCPICGKPYGFPLTNPPSVVGEFKIVKSLGRGFYGATYVAEKQGIIRRKHVLKVVPKAVYREFKKSFEEECTAHSQAADGADYIVDISDAFDAPVLFQDNTMECHVAVLEYLDGYLLQDHLSGKQKLTAASVAQIAADLFRIRDELVVRKRYHNDFHAGNIIIEKLSKERYRQGAMDPSIRAVAIDFGSLSEDRRADESHKSDLHWIAQHIQNLVSSLSENKSDLSDMDSRLTLALMMDAKSIAPADENQRTPSSEEFVRKIEDAFFRSAEPWRPWRAPLALRKFDESYNAQTLEAWNVPQLLVDPDRDWQKAISSTGPLIITGMRGCGKTMLLRALQFHARAAQRPGEADGKILDRVRSDGYLGLFVSASAFLTLSDGQLIKTENMFARLAIAYTLEAVRSLAHLADIESSVVRERAAQNIQDTLDSILQDQYSDQQAATIQQLERKLVHQLNDACSSGSTVRLASHPSNAFPLLASSIRQCSEIWESSQVLFLLDEVSTRFLTPIQIEEILSALIFQKPDCAFKLTSETQTIFLSLKSPGGVEPAAHWRDFETFDLGAEVHKRLKRKGGKKFIEDILSQRAKFFSGHPQTPPGTVLGNQSLVDIARTISSSGPNSKMRKMVYHGISALKAVCVGDIGSAITIYENILNRSNGLFPVEKLEQSNVFQDFCSTHLYLLDRRDSHLKNIAKSFAAASYEELMRSAKSEETRELRQFASIYIRVTAGDMEEQGRQLRELIDAGVFVFQGGSPRTKTKDSDPVLQFKLTFRKIYGLADFIGLSERDRFELSGSDLVEWLNNPEKGKEILRRNLPTEEDPDGDYIEDEEELALPTPTVKNGIQEGSSQRELDLVNSEEEREDAMALELPVIESFEPSSTKPAQIDTLYIALGFEERTAASAMRSIDLLSPRSIVALSYPEEGRSENILKAINFRGIPCSVVEYADLRAGKLELLNSSIAVDVTGFTKAAIFQLINGALKRNSEVVVVYTEAEAYYPLEESVQKTLAAHSEKNSPALLAALKGILSGEEGPYSLEKLHSLVSDETRMKALLAFGSAKHERIIQLVEDGDYDLIKVLCDNSSTARATVGKLAAEAGVRGAAAGSIEECDIKNPNEVLHAIERVFRSTYIEGGFNFEFGLTGDKLETVAVAVFCAIVNVNSVWYVKPKRFDPKRFSEGTKETHFYRVII